MSKLVDKVTIDGEEHDVEDLSAVDKALTLREMLLESLGVSELPVLNFRSDTDVPDAIFAGPFDGNWLKIPREPWVEEAVLAGSIISSLDPETQRTASKEELTPLVESIMKAMSVAEEMEDRGLTVDAVVVADARRKLEEEDYH